MLTHFIEVQATTMPEDEQFALNKFLNRFHGIVSSHSLNLGLAFPEIETSKCADLGQILRVFGASGELKTLRSNGGIEALVASRLVAISPLQEVPHDATRVAYVRSRASEKLTGSGIRRRERRLRRRQEARGQQWEKEDSAALRECLSRRTSGVHEAKEEPYMLIERQGRKIPLFVKKIYFGEFLDEPCFNRYGLGNGEGGELSAVYDF